MAQPRLDELTTAIDMALRVLRGGLDTDQDNILALVQVLDVLLAWPQGVVRLPDRSLYPAPPMPPYDVVRQMVRSRFPNYGDYDVSVYLRELTGQPAVGRGNAVEDLCVICRELFVIRWRLDNTSLLDALWHLEQGLNSGWGQHVRRLRAYWRSQGLT